MRSDQRVLLIGRGATSHSALDGLVGRFDVVGLIRDGDDETTARAAELGVPVFGDTSVLGVTTTLESTDPDAVVVSSYDRIIGDDLIADRPFVNVHYAPLPRGRGRATVNWALINGDDAAWISIHHLVADLDAGGILFQASVPIGPQSTVASLYRSLNELQREHIADAVAAAIAGEPGAAQDHDSATYYCTRVPDDGEIDWSSPTASIDRLVRALQPPFPLAFTWLGLQRVEVVRATEVENARVFEGRVPGRVSHVDRAGGSVDVLTGDGLIRIERVRLDGGDIVPASDVIRSVSATLGLRVTDLVRALRSAVEDR